MQLTGAEVMVKCLEEEGVSTIFGIPVVLYCRFTTLCVM